MNTAMNYPENPWLLEETVFNEAWLGKGEAIFSLGNGYLGLRSATEERYVQEKRNLFVAGTFNKFADNEVTELPNLPDFLNIELSFNGKKLDLTQGTVTNYKRWLDLQSGELTRSFCWELGDIKVELMFNRFVSLKQKHFIGQSVTIKNLGQDCELRIVSGIDGQQTNSGVQHLTEGDKRLLHKELLQMKAQTTQSEIDLHFLTTHRFPTTDKQDFQQRIEMERRKIQERFWKDLQPDESITFEKISGVFTSIDLDWQGEEVAQALLQEAAQQGYQALMEASAQAWQAEVWSHFPITIQSTQSMDQRAIHFARYHLHAMTPKDDARMNIGAKGLSGEGYKGHTFWDTEIFMLPYFTFTYPEIAENLLMYRYLGLAGARRKAQANGYQGAQYPWEAAWPDDGETTPVWGAADIVTGEATKIWSGFIEQHITSDVAFGVKQFLEVTQRPIGEPGNAEQIIFETAQFWSSRLEWKAERQRYEICGVIGPDEYKEHVDNNAFTNYMAYWNMQTAIDFARELQFSQLERYNRLNEQLDLDALIPELLEKTAFLYLPQTTATHLLPQDDTYLFKDTLDLTPYKQDQQVGTLFHDYNLEQVNQLQITKQADVLLLMLLREKLFAKDTIQRNWAYYEPKTMHDSSLSLATHAILAADLGEVEKAYDFFQQALRIDLGENMQSSNEGIHAASLGGIWQAIVFGFGGVRNLEGDLRIEPHLPSAWQSLEFGIEWQQQPLTIQVEPTQFTVTNHGTHNVTFTAFGTNYTVETTQVVSLKGAN